MPPNEPGLADALRAMPDEAMTLGQLLARLGSRAHGLALVVLALPDIIPLPVPSVSAIVGVPLVIVSAHLLVYGESGRLPLWLDRRRVPQAVVRLLKSRGAGALSLGERLARPRWPAIARRERAVGAASLVLALLLLLPLPLFNAPPAFCLVLLGWGLVRRDGALVLAGLAATLVVLAVVGLTALGALDLLRGAAAAA